MHTIKDRPVVVNGQVVIRPIMVVALTYDHRLLDAERLLLSWVRVLLGRFIFPLSLLTDCILVFLTFALCELRCPTMASSTPPLFDHAI